MVEDIFDILTSEPDIFDDVSGPDVFDSLSEETLKPLTEDEIMKLIRGEFAKLPKVQKVIERSVPVYIEPKVIQAPEAKPQIIKEVRVEVQKEKKDTTKYAELSKFQDLLVKFMKLERKLEETTRMASFPIIAPGGSGVIGLPVPSNHGGEYVTTDGSTYKLGPIIQDPMYIGDPTVDGNWRITISGTSLSVQRLESGAWTEKGSFNP